MTVASQELNGVGRHDAGPGEIVIRERFNSKELKTHSSPR
jgi:hypothetical protein